MAKIDAHMLDYAFVDAKNESVLVIPEDYTKDFCLLGIANRSGFPNGSLLKTSVVQKLEKHYAKTKSGTKYILGNMNEDYLDFVFAVHEGIPVLEKWNVMGAAGKNYVTGICDGATIEGEIKEQCGNYLILEDGRKLFVNWLNFSDEIAIRIVSERPVIHGLRYPKDFEFFANCQCRPVLKLK